MVIRILDEEHVLNLLDWDSTFDAVKVALESVTKNQIDQNPRSFTKFKDNYGSLLLSMPGCLVHPKYGAVACKLVTMNPNNEKREDKLATINANIALFDNDTGILKAIIGGTEITKWRTAAASAVATSLLTKDRKILAILGAGTQGRIHAIAFQHFFNFNEIRIWNHNPEKAATLVKELNDQSTNKIFKHFQSNEDCVRGADVIVTATFASSPIVQLEWLNEVQNVHINAVGAGINHHSELSPAIYETGDIYVDYLMGAKTELSGLIDSGIEFKGEIGGIIAGNEKGDNRITIFQSLGMAVEDCAMARLVYDRYLKERSYLLEYYKKN